MIQKVIRHDLQRSDAQNSEGIYSHCSLRQDRPYVGKKWRENSDYKKQDIYARPLKKYTSLGHGIVHDIPNGRFIDGSIIPGGI